MQDYKNPQLIIETSKLKSGTVSWRCPSNIALIKYWGKHGRQLPRNPSISFTLDNAYTETHLSYEPKTGADAGKIDMQFFFEGQPNEQFGQRVSQFLNSITDVFPFLKQMQLTIRSSNSFPHSAGIASSASSMGALALCLCSLEDQLFGTLKDIDAFRQKASFVARLGSGSACRSIYAGMGLWGETTDVEGSSELFAVPYENEMHDVFKTFHDDILIISKSEKSVSSRAGHDLMDGNIYADNRYLQARQNMQNLLPALRKGDIDIVGKTVEREALTLHALMMSSNPPYVLMEPNSLAAIQKVKQFRKDTGHPIYFSLDAGPNLHLLYPEEIKPSILPFIESELKPLCENGQVISDKVGLGPLELAPQEEEDQ